MVLDHHLEPSFRWLATTIEAEDIGDGIVDHLFRNSNATVVQITNILLNRFNLGI